MRKPYTKRSRNPDDVRCRLRPQRGQTTKPGASDAGAQPRECPPRRCSPERAGQTRGTGTCVPPFQGLGRWPCLPGAALRWPRAVLSGPFGAGHCTAVKIVPFSNVSGISCPAAGAGITAPAVGPAAGGEARPYKIIPAATVSLVPASMRMKLPVMRFLAYGSNMSGALVWMAMRPMSFIWKVTSSSILWSVLMFTL